jgi:hypothetical protein
VNCTATDSVGNIGRASFTVTVTRTGWYLDGVYANGPKSAGSAVPLDFGFTATAGGPRVSSSNANPSVSVFLVGPSCKSASPPGPLAQPTVTYPSGSSDYRYSAASLNWQFNWKPSNSVPKLGAGCYYIRVTTGNQSLDSVRPPVQLTK